MKSLNLLALAAILTTTFASAMVSPNWERPIFGAALHSDESTGQPRPIDVRRATYLTMNQASSAAEPTSFTLQEDTGIRCVMAPCPSTVETTFEITRIIYSMVNGPTRYEAREVLRNIPPHVRIAPRTLLVDQSDMEIVAPGGNGFQNRIVWRVEIQTFANESKFYFGNPQYLATIQLF